MNLEINYETINSPRVITNDSRTKLVEGDLVVSDIKPDILSLSNIEAEVYLKDINVSDGKIFVSGAVDVCTIYVAEDEIGSIRSLNNLFNFNEEILIKEITKDSKVDVKLRRGTVEYKIVNSRKVNVKVPVIIEYIIKETNEISVAREVVDDRNVQVLRKECVLDDEVFCKEQNIDMNEIISLEESNLPIAEILKATMKLENPEYKISYNKILVKVDAIIKIIYVVDSEEVNVESYEKVIPITGVIEAEGINSDDEICLDFKTKSFTIRPLYQDLKSLSFGVESEIGVKVCMTNEKSFALLEDVYSPDVYFNCKYKEIEINKDIIRKKVHLNIANEVQITDLNNLKLLDVKLDADNINVQIFDERINLAGNIDVEFLCFNKLTKVIENKRGEIPVIENIKVDELKNDLRPKIKLHIGKVDIVKTSASSLEFKVELIVEIKVEEKMIIKGIEEIESSNYGENDIASLTLYYVKEGDTLWKIAKKYRTTVDALKEYNDLNDDLIFPGEQVLIPKRCKDNKIALL